MIYYLIDILDKHSWYIGLPVTIVCLYLKYHIIRTCKSHPLYKE